MPPQVRQRLINTRRRMEDLLAGNQPSGTADCYETTEELAAPLLACYWSLWDCGAWLVLTFNAGAQRPSRASLLSVTRAVRRHSERFQQGSGSYACKCLIWSAKQDHRGH